VLGSRDQQRRDVLVRGPQGQEADDRHQIVVMPAHRAGRLPLRSGQVGLLVEGPARADRRDRLTVARLVGHRAPPPLARLIFLLDLVLGPRPDVDQRLDREPFVVGDRGQLRVILDLPRPGRQGADLVDLEGEDLLGRQRDLVEAAPAVAAVRHPPQPQEGVDRGVVLDPFQEQPGGALQPTCQVGRWLEAAEQRGGQLDAEPLRAAEVEAHRLQRHAQALEPLSDRAGVLEADPGVIVVEVDREQRAPEAAGVLLDARVAVPVAVQLQVILKPDRRPLVGGVSVGPPSRLDGLDVAHVVPMVGPTDGGVHVAVDLGRIAIREQVGDRDPDVPVGATGGTVERKLAATDRDLERRNRAGADGAMDLPRAALGRVSARARPVTEQVPGEESVRLGGVEPGVGDRTHRHHLKQPCGRLRHLRGIWSDAVHFFTRSSPFEWQARGGSHWPLLAQGLSHVCTEA
jgi:hypothetical protein